VQAVVVKSFTSRFNFCIDLVHWCTTEPP